jgi:hypothetical protein
VFVAAGYLATWRNGHEFIMDRYRGLRAASACLLRVPEPTRRCLGLLSPDPEVLRAPVSELARVGLGPFRHVGTPTASVALPPRSATASE